MKNIILKILIPITLLTIFSGCSVDNGEASGNTTILPSDNLLNLSCATVGLGNEQCILDDDENPFKNVLVNNINKWELYEATTSPKARFYLWATALAHNPFGENQYYTAISLHELYTSSRSINAKSQAKLAYRYLLDNYFDSVTFATRTKPFDLQIDTDFTLGNFNTGTTLEYNYFDDEAYEVVFEVNQTNSSAIALVAFQAIQSIQFGDYQNLVFKLKGLDNNVSVQFVQAGGVQEDVTFNLSEVATDIDGRTGWKQVTIPLSANYTSANLNLYNNIAIKSTTNGSTFYITDLGFTGDATGEGLKGDDDNDGLVSFYKTDREDEQYAIPLKDITGEKLIEPSGNFGQLFSDQNEANETLNIWGYKYNINTNTLERN